MPVHLHKRLVGVEKLLVQKKSYKQFAKIISIIVVIFRHVVMRLVGKKLPDPPKSKREFAARAYRRGWWVYSKSSKRWYSPEEFMKSTELFDARTQDEDFGIHDPGIGVMERFRKLEKMIQELGEFMGRVNSYYERKPRRKGK